jgi:hypothetical protein
MDGDERVNSAVRQAQRGGGGRRGGGGSKTDVEASWFDLGINKWLGDLQCQWIPSVDTYCGGTLPPPPRSRRNTEDVD